jgi:hypothetical protein
MMVALSDDRRPRPSRGIRRSGRWSRQVRIAVHAAPIGLFWGAAVPPLPLLHRLCSWVIAC